MNQKRDEERKAAEEKRPILTVPKKQIKKTNPN